MSSLPTRLARCILPALLVLVPLISLALPVPPAPPGPGLPGWGRQAPPSPTALGETSRESWDRYREGGARDAEPDSVHVLALLVAFSDLDFPESYFEDYDPLGVLGVPDSLVETVRHDWFTAKLQRVDDYFRTVSGDRVHIGYTLPDTVFVLPGEMGLYGDDQIDWTFGVHHLAVDAVALADSLHDFSAYDLTVFIHAGAGQESDLMRDSPEQIWSGYVDFESLQEAFADSLPEFEGIVTADQDSSYRLCRFAVAPEKEIEESLDPDYVLGALGVYVHQMAGYLGLISLNDYISPRGQGAGNFDLMSSGLWNALGFVPGPPSAFNRMLMGWTDVQVHSRLACEDGRPLEVASLGAEGHVLHRFPISEREYFLVENRDQDADGDGAFSFDDANGNHVPDNGESLLGAELDYFTTQLSSSDSIPGSGLLFWRIDEELVHLSFELGSNVINAWNDHYGVFLLEADGYPDLTVSPGYHSEAYGSDYDAFRDAGGPSDLVATQTGFGRDGFPSTRSAEGAATGWRFSDVGPHGTSMNYMAWWAAPEGWQVATLPLPTAIPVGDPLLMPLGGMTPAFVYAATDGADSSFVYAVEGEPAAERLLFAVAALAVAGPAAGDLDGDDADEIVLLGEEGEVFLWTGDEDPGVVLEPLHVLEGFCGPGPLLYDIDGDGDLDMLVQVHDEDETRLFWLDENGDVIDSFQYWESLWSGPLPGQPLAAPVLLLSVPAEARGYDHAEPYLASFGFVTATDSTTHVHVLAHTWAGATGSWTLDGGCTRAQLAAGDLDAEGSDELLLLRDGAPFLIYPWGRWGGDLDGETLIVPSPPFAAGDPSAYGAALLPADADGNGSLEVLGLYPDEMNLWTADGAPLEDWPRELPSSAPLIWSDEPAVWTLLLRDGDGADRPLLFTRDGRVFVDGDPAGEPLLLGAVLVSSPVLVETEGEWRAEGLSFFEPLEGNTAGEDTLLAGRVLKHWRLELGNDFPMVASWPMGGADAARTGRLAAAGPLEIDSAGGEFASAYLYPNPAAGSVTWRVQGDRAERVDLEIFDLEGQSLWRDEILLDGFSPAERELSLDGVPSGVYFYRIHGRDSGRLSVGRLAVIR